MTPKLSPPDHEQLQKLLLGQLPSAEAERLAAEYADDSRLAALAESLAGQDDTLLKLRDQETAVVDTDDERLVARLVQRLKTALPAAHDTAVSNPNDATLPPRGPAAAPGTRPLPEQLEYYKPLKVLGQGGMGTVYLALDTRLGREVALKTLRPELAANPQAKERFLREARTAAKLEHDNIIPIYYVGEADGTPFLAMPLLKGEPLDALLKRTNGPLPLAQAVRIAREAASGLAAAHEAGLIHRDIKPANIWLEAPNGRVKVLDFGLAKSAAANETKGDADLTAYGAIVGTPAYMAPEQAGGKPVDGRADLFSLGCVLYEMLAGTRPFAGPDTMSILMSLATHTPAAPHTLKPQCPAALSKLVMQLLEKDPAARPASAQAVMEALDKVELAPQVERPRLSPAKPQAVGKASRTASGSAGFNRRASLGLAVALLALLPLGYLFGAQIIRIVTNQGQIVIETDGAGIEVVIKDGEGKVLDKETKREITFKAGEYNIEVTITDAGGEQRFVTDHFELKRNGKKMVDARWEVAKAKSAGDADRKAAEYVLSIGGIINIKENGQDRRIEAAGEPPEGAFELLHVYLILNPKVSDAGLVHLKNCKHLTALFLRSRQVSDAGMAHFKDCKNLTELSLQDTQVSNAGLAHFKDCKSLANLSLMGTKVSDAGLVHFQDCKNLSFLFLSDTLVGDTGLAYLKNYKNLTEVGLVATQVSDAGLAHLAECPKLRYVHVSKTTVTADGVKKLAAALPNCKIEWDGGVIEPTMVNDRKAALVRGNWRIVGDVIEQVDKEKQALLLFGRPDFADGDFTCEVLRSEGDHGLALVARATDLENYYYFDIGVFENNYHSLYAKEAGSNWRRIDQQKAEPVPTDRWVKLQLRLRGESWEGYLDGKLVVSGKDDRRLKGYLGLRTWNEAGKYRNLQFTDPAGKVLWSGLPELPPIEPKEAAPSSDNQGSLPPKDYDKLATGRWTPVMTGVAVARRNAQLSEGRIEIQDGHAYDNSLLAADVIVRAKVQKLRGQTVMLTLRDVLGVYYSAFYHFDVDEHFGIGMRGVRFNYGVKQQFKTSVAVNEGEFFELAFSAVGDTLTVYANGKRVGEIRDSAITKAGGVAVHATKGQGVFKEVEVMVLEKPAP